MDSKVFMTKQLCFINVESNQQNTLYVEVENIMGELDLSDTIQKFNEPCCPNKKRRYTVDPAGHHELAEPYLLPRSFVGKNLLILYYRDEVVTEPDLEEQCGKKERNRERTIREVIESIKKWRSFHKARIDGLKVNLVQAAQMVGISKKSLDDYFCQLRLGEKYGFDFMDHLDDKIGVLRAFVKKIRPKNERSHKNEKHPKTLRIIQDFEVRQCKKEDLKESPELFVPDLGSLESTPSRDQPQRDYNMTPMDQQQTSQFENQFFHLDMILNEPKDPFVHYLARDYRNFKKQDYGVGDILPKEQEMIEATDFMW